MRKRKDAALRSTARRRDLADDLDVLLDALCTQCGYCNSLRGRQLLAAHDPLTADEFAVAVMTAEGFPDPQHEPRLLRHLKRVFADRYGGTVSSRSYAAMGE